MYDFWDKFSIIWANIVEEVAIALIILGAFFLPSFVSMFVAFIAIIMLFLKTMPLELRLLTQKYISMIMLALIIIMAFIKLVLVLTLDRST